MKNKTFSLLLTLVLTFSFSLSAATAFEGPTEPPSRVGVFGNAGRIMRTFFDNAFVNNNPFPNETAVNNGSITASNTGSLLGRLGFIVDQINNLKNLFFSGGKLRASALPAEGVWNNTGGIVISSGADLMIAMTGGDIILNANNLNFSGSVVVTGGLSVNGNISANNITGVLTTAAQTNITSVGTLGSLTVNGTLVGSVVATTAEATGGTVTNKVMTPASTRNASAYNTPKQYSNSVNVFPSNSNGWTTTYSAFIPYQTSNGIWRLKFNLQGTFTTPASWVALSVSGIKILNGKYQSFSASQNDNNTIYTIRTSTTWVDHLNAWFSGAIQSAALSGDIELMEKPTWAD